MQFGARADATHERSKLYVRLESVQAENCLVVCRITDKTFEGIPIIGVPL
jgi:hypothetical protein